jgi:formylglycine-generating enzyme required for sulfatase activity
VDLPLASAELGLEPDGLTKVLDVLARRTTTAGLSQVLSPLRVAGGTVKRDVIVSVFGRIVEAGGLGVFLRPSDIDIPLVPVPPGPGPLQPGKVTNSIGMMLVLIPQGEFQMGSPTSEEERSRSLSEN